MCESDWEPNMSGVIRRPAYPADVVPTIGEIMNCTTAWQVFVRSVRRNPDSPYVGRRVFNRDGSRGKYLFQSYKTAYNTALHLGIGINKVTGVKPGEHVALWMPNCPEWVLLEQACNRYGFVSVPLFDALSKEQTEFVIDHSDARVIFTHPRTSAAALAAAPRCPNLEYIVELDTEFDAAMAAGFTLAPPDRVGRGTHEADLPVWRPYQCVSTGQLVTSNDISDPCFAPMCNTCGALRHRRAPVKLMKYSEILHAGAAAVDHPWVDNPPCPPTQDDTASLVYTSGTTGTPKGVIVLHRALMATLAGWYSAGVYLYEGDVHLSILPLAHVYERSVSHALVAFGGSLAFPSNGVHDLLGDVAAARPCFLIGVPRLFEKISTGVQRKIEKLPAAKRALFWSVFRLKEALGAPGKRFLGPLDDAVFGDIRAALGGRCRFIISGSAPLPHFVYRFFFIAFGLEAVLQGYGLTETAAAGTVTDFLNPVPSVGYNCPILELKLASVPGTVYNPILGTGELLIRGQAVTPGYYKNTEASRSAMTVDGWLRTGDVARLNLDGSVSIIDRRKNLIKLGQGEYVSVERLESIFSGCSYVENIFIHGSGYESQLVAVVVPAYSVLKSLVETQQPRYCSVATFSGLVNSPSFEGGLGQKLAASGEPSPGTSSPCSSAGTNPESSMRQEELNAWASSPAIAALVTAELAAFGRAHGLRGFELPASIIIEPSSFTVENSMLTPTMKLRRPAALKKYSKRFDSLYADMHRRSKARQNDVTFGNDVTAWITAKRARMATGFQSWTDSRAARGLKSAQAK